MSADTESGFANRNLAVDMPGVEWRAVAKSVGITLLLGLLAAPLVAGSSYIGYVALTVVIFAVMASGYNLMLGWPNLLVFCPAALAIIGGVTSALLVNVFGVPYLVAMVSGGVVAAVIGGFIAFSAIAIGSSFEIIIATLAFEEIVYYVFTNWHAVGPTGISNVPAPTAGPLTFQTQLEQYLFLLVMLTISIGIVAVFDRSLTGTLTVATSENEDLLRSIGYNPKKYKFIAVVVGALLLGIGGSLYAHVNGLITPGGFTLDQTVFLLVIAVVGGIRTVHGPIVGAIVLVGLPEVVRMFGLSNMKPYIIGGMLVVVVLFFPRGILGGLYDAIDNRGDLSWQFWK
ncbi:branched-chain amino acid ABC transporter permease [Halocalculus aciditolerans]|uniref:Branched-chain amino acid ABC transporter permease n=1 Tax=Halocalculus aciditolerans TaxID=1383812 RepID=A0A830FKU6_9EURY|nr:branched-chain amino acid ABC transporter permease [Halocalculus aciditolerans]GGL66002.1 branched-chain amino acid ABC transporter permease [Halocalculus aciditolerans]